MLIKLVPCGAGWLLFGNLRKFGGFLLVHSGKNILWLIAFCPPLQQVKSISAQVNQRRFYRQS